MDTSSSVPEASLTALPPPIVILGVPFDVVTTEQTVALIADMIASRRPHYLATANVDFVVQALEDVELRRILFDAHLVLADGMPLVWASRRLGNPLPERVTGSDLVPRLLGEAEGRGWRVFFLGGTGESVAKAAANTTAKHPLLQLVGAYSPPFKPLLEMDHEAIVRRVRAARPDLLLVAFGCPKQEKWINMHYRALGVPVSIGVGATIDFLAGTVKRAPVWMQKSGTEWLFRMAQEPKRLAGRYGKGFRVFARAIVQQAWELRSRSARSVASMAPAQPVGEGTVVDSIRVIPVPARLDAPAAGAVRETWLAAVGKEPLVLDLGATSLVDSTGIGLLVRLQKHAGETGHRLILASVQPPLESALRLTRLINFFHCVPDVSAARQSCRATPPPISRASVMDGTGLRWHGEITAVTAPQLAGQVEASLAAWPEGARVTVDLGDVPFADSSGIALMVKLKKACWRRGVRLVFTGPTPAVQNVLKLTRLAAFLIEETP